MQNLNAESEQNVQYNYITVATPALQCQLSTFRKNPLTSDFDVPSLAAKTMLDVLVFRPIKVIKFFRDVSKIVFDIVAPKE